ncbi:MAG: hypothetical protein M5U34_30780 [Chloroflexi bacterium]|nr:hypothetical protein [Chloroflexota bacterium]
MISKKWLISPLVLNQKPHQLNYRRDNENLRKSFDGGGLLGYLYSVNCVSSYPRFSRGASRSDNGRPPDQAVVEIEPALTERFVNDGESGYLIYFRAAPDLSPADNMSWEERGWFVMEKTSGSGRSLPG